MRCRILLFFTMLFLFSNPYRVKADCEIGVLIYKEGDSFTQSLAAELVKYAEGRAEISLDYSEGNQRIQNQQIESLLNDQKDALILNAQDCVSAIYPIRMAMKSHTPIVFINCEPLKEDLKLYPLSFFVGSSPMQLGAVCGSIVSDYWQANPDADRNRDGVMQSVILQGNDDQNGVLRTQSTIEAIQDAGISMEILDRRKASWTRNLGEEEMSYMLTKYGTDIEMVICNNDEMAIGAVDALRLAGYFTNGNYMPVVGIDATEEALKLVENGVLLGTVVNDAQRQAEVILETALKLAEGEPVGKEKITREEILKEAEGQCIYISGDKIVSPLFQTVMKTDAQKNNAEKK